MQVFLYLWKAFGLQLFARSEAMLSIQGDPRERLEESVSMTLHFIQENTLQHWIWSTMHEPLAAPERQKLVEIYPNAQCSVRMYAVYRYYFYNLYSAYESVKHAGICVDGTFCMETWGTCSLFCFSTSEVLSCSGMLSMTPQQVHCWLWCWTWNPSGIGPLFGKSTSHWTCITWTWF